MSNDFRTRPLAALLTARENVRVAKVTTQRIGHQPDMTRAQYAAELRVTAAELYPHKVSA